MTVALKILVFLLILAAMPANAQEYEGCPRTMQGYGGFGAPSAEGLLAQKKRDEAARIDACKRMLESDPAPFSYWGCRHAEAHCKRWAEQLQESTGVSCCSSPYDGECRVSRLGEGGRTVEIDGISCPVPVGVHWGGILGIEVGLVLVCANPSQTDASGVRRCPTIYCIGAETGF